MTMIVKTPDGTPLNMRASTSTTSARLAQIPNGTTVDVIREGTDWTGIKYNNKEGWVLTKYLSKDAGAPTLEQRIEKIENVLKKHGWL